MVCVDIIIINIKCVMANNGVNLNPGAYTIYSRKLNDYRKELLKQA